MALLGFWTAGFGRIPDICTASNRNDINGFNDEDDGLPSYSPNALYMDANETLLWTFPDRASTADSIIVGFWGRLTGTTDDATPWYLRQIGTNNYLRLDASGTAHEITVRSATGPTSGTVTTFGTATGIDPDDYHFYELEWKPGDADGIVRLRIDGITPSGWVDQVNVDTNADVASTELTIGFEQRSSTWLGITSGIYALDTSGGANDDFLGICRFPMLTVVDDLENDMLGTDGNSVDNWQLLDDSPSTVPASYGSGGISSSTVGHRQRSNVEDLSALGLDAGSTVLAVNAAVYGQSDTAAAETIDYGLNSNGTESTGNGELLGNGDFGSHHTTFETDPDTAVAWTEAGVDAVTLFAEIPA